MLYALCRMPYAVGYMLFDFLTYQCSKFQSFQISKFILSSSGGQAFFPPSANRHFFLLRRTGILHFSFFIFFHRSISDNTKSTLPRIAIKSAIVYPLLISVQTACAEKKASGFSSGKNEYCCRRSDNIRCVLWWLPLRKKLPRVE